MSKGKKFKTRNGRIVGETRQEYLQSEKQFLGNFQDTQINPKGFGSALDPAIVNQHLPTKEEEHKMLETWDRMLTKSSRSGAFSPPNSGPLLLPSGRSALSWIDEMATPGRHKLQQDDKPVLRQQTRDVDTPAAAVTLTTRCVDCLKELDTNDASNITFHAAFAVAMKDNKPDTAKLFSMGLLFGDIILAAMHTTCAKKAKQLVEDDRAAHLILIRDGALTSTDEMEQLVRTGHNIYLHNGQEMSAGQYYMHVRQHRLNNQIESWLIAMDKTSKAFRRNRDLDKGELDTD